MKKRVFGDGEKPLKGGDYIDAMTEKVPTTGERIMEVPVAQVREKSNVRQEYDNASIAELAESIRQQGLLQPITVAAAENGYYDILFGHRRYRAFVLLSQTDHETFLKIKCIVKTKGEFNEKEILVQQLIENVQRENVTGRDMRAALEELKGRGLTHREIAERLGKAEGYVKNIFMAIRAVNASPELEAVLKSHTGVTLADIQTVRPLPLKNQLDLLSAKAEGNITSRARLEERVQELKAELYETGRNDRKARKRFEVMAVRPDGSLKVRSFLVHKDKLKDDDRERIQELIAELQKLLGKGGKK